MTSYTIEQHVQMIKLYYQNECSLVQTLRALRPFYGRRGGPSKSTLQRLVAKCNGGQIAMHPQKVTVWCGFWAGGVIGPYFFENDVGEAITVNGERYRTMITNFFWPKLNDMDVDDMWFQQDGATCHTADATMDILHERFEGMVISRRGDVNWPPRSCDLTPLDFFLWGFLKSQVYANKPQSTDALKVNITQAIAQIQPDLCGRIIENWTTRIRATVRSRGGHLNDVIFHT